MKKGALFVVLLLGLASAGLRAQQPDRFFYKYYTGTLGSAPLSLHLQHSDGQYVGYGYRHTGTPLSLEGWAEGDRIKLVETPAIPTNPGGGSFSLEWGYGNQLSGRWVSADSSQQLEVVLHESRPPLDFSPLVREFLFQKTSIGNQKAAEVQVWEFPIAYWLLQPQFNGRLAPEVQDSLSRNLLACADYSLSELCLNQQALEAYREATAENTLPALNFSLQRQQYVMHQSQQVVVIKEVESSFWGGAHGNHRIRYFNLDLNTGRNLRLSAIFRPEQLDSLAALIQQQATVATSVEEVRAGLKEFYLSPGGIGFTFNTYSIASYAEGPQEFFFSYAKLSKALGSVSVVQTYLD